jgi:hypothetical protein
MGKNKWETILEELKERFSGEVKVEGKVVTFSGKCKDRDIIISPVKGCLSYQIQAKSDFELGLTIQGSLSNFKKKFVKFQDINIGVKDFDKEFIIRGDPEEKVIEFLFFGKVRDTIRTFAPIHSLDLDKSTLIIKTSIPIGAVVYTEKIESQIEKLVFLADAIENPDRIEEIEVDAEPDLPKLEKKFEDMKKDDKFSQIERLDKLEIKVKELEGRIKKLELK